MRKAKDLVVINRMIEFGRTEFIRNLGKALKTAPPYEFEQIKRIFHSQWVNYMCLKTAKHRCSPKPKKVIVPNYLKVEA